MRYRKQNAFDKVMIEKRQDKLKAGQVIRYVELANLSQGDKKTLWENLKKTEAGRHQARAFQQASRDFVSRIAGSTLRMTQQDFDYYMAMSQDSEAANENL